MKGNKRIKRIKKRQKDKKKNAKSGKRKKRRLQLFCGVRTPRRGVRTPAGCTYTCGVYVHPGENPPGRVLRKELIE